MTETQPISSNQPISSIESLKAVYENCCELHRYFLTWRHQLLAGYLATLAALGIAYSWTYVATNNARPLAWVVCLLGTFLTIIFLVAGLQKQRPLPRVPACCIRHRNQIWIQCGAQFNQGQRFVRRFGPNGKTEDNSQSSNRHSVLRCGYCPVCGNSLFALCDSLTIGGVPSHNRTYIEREGDAARHVSRFASRSALWYLWTEHTGLLSLVRFHIDNLQYTDHDTATKVRPFLIYDASLFCCMLLYLYPES